MPDPELEVQDDSIETPAGEDSEKNDPFNIDDLKDEDEGLGEDKKPKVEKSEIAQKLKWREKYKQTVKDLDALKAEIAAQKSKPAASDDKERAAWELLDKRIEEKLHGLLLAKKREEEKAVEELDDKLEETKELYPDLKEDDLMDTMEEFGVGPDVAAKILMRKDSPKKDKPSLPSPKRSSAAKPAQKKEDAKKTIFQIAQDIKKDLQELVQK